MALRKEELNRNVGRTAPGKILDSSTNDSPDSLVSIIGHSTYRESQPTGLAHELRFGDIAFADFLTSLEGTCPEIGEKKDGIMNAGRELVASHNVSPDFFAAPDNAIGLLFAAALHDDALNTSGKSSKRIEKETHLAKNFARTLFGPYSETHPHEGVKRATVHEPKERVKFLKKYQNLELSNRLHEWIMTSDEMRKIREELQITDGREDNFEMMVLSVGQPLHTEGLGKSPDAPYGINEYVKELHERGKTFMNEQQSSEDDALPYAWVSRLDGTNYLCVSEPIARIVLEPESVGYKDTGEGTRDFMIDLMRHDLVHTQGNIQLVDQADTTVDSYLGIMLEEYRAEKYSGYKSKSAYADIYRVIGTIEDLKGFSLGELMQKFALGGAQNKNEFYAAVAGRAGLVNTALLVGLLPDDYADFQSPRSSREIHQVLSETIMMDEVMLHMSHKEFASYLERKDLTEEIKNDYWKWLREIR